MPSLLCHTNKDQRRVAALNGMTLAEWDCLLCRRCPQYETCGARDCPLDFLQGCRGPSFPDETETCHAYRKSRHRVITEAQAAGLQFELHHDGLTLREVYREERADRYREQMKGMSEEHLEMLRSNRFARSKPSSADDPLSEPHDGAVVPSAPDSLPVSAKVAEQNPPSATLFNDQEASHA